MTKILPVAILLVVLLIPPVRESVSSLVQSAIIHSGFADASDSSNKKNPFDYDFEIRDLSGHTVDFKEFKGKVVFLNLWATWCGPCRNEMPSIQKLYEEVDKTNISFVMLSLDDQAISRKVKSFVEKSGYSFPVYINNGYLTEQLRVPTIPTTFVIDKNGNISLQEVGMRNYNTTKFKKYLNQLAQ